MGTIRFDFGAVLTETTTADQDAKLQRLLTRVNAERAAQTPPQAAITLEQYLRFVLREAIKSWMQQVAATDRDDACAEFKKLSAADQEAILVKLGGLSPCP